MLQRISSGTLHRTCNAQGPLHTLSLVFSIPQAGSPRYKSSKSSPASSPKNPPTTVSKDQLDQVAPQVITLQYHIRRTPANNLPVYQAATGGGTKRLTTIRRINGDLASLQQDLRQGLGVPDENVHINPLTRTVLVKGWVKDQVVKFLEERNF